MSYLFNDCKSLTSLNLTKFNTKKVYYMKNMFSNCVNLKKLDISSFNTYAY